MRLPTDPFTNSPLTFPLTFMLTHGLNGSEYSTLLLLLAACDPLVARDSRLIDSANTGRPILQGAALSFDGSTQHGEYDTGNTDADGLGAVTISAWVNPSVSGATRVLWAKGNSAYRCYLSTSDLIYINSTSTGISITESVWSKVTVIYNIAGQGTELLINGASMWSGVIPAGSAAPSTKFIVSGRDDAGVGVLYEGSIQDFKITGDTNQHWDLRDNGLSALTSGTDLTLVGSPVSVTDNTIPVDPANERGFTDDNGTIYLARADDPSTDVLGNPTQWQGSAYPVRPVERQSSALSFDGATQYGTTSILPTAIGSLECYFYSDNTSGNKLLMGSESASNCFLSVSNGKLSGGIGDEWWIHILGTTALQTGKWYHAKITWDGVTVKLFLDDIEEYSGAQVGSAINGKAIYIACKNTNGTPNTFFDGTLSNPTINGTRFPLAEGAGSTAYSTDGTSHGTLVGNPTWVLEDGIPSSNLNDGFSLYEHASLDPIRVPYGDNGQPLTITPPTGYTKTSDNPAVSNGPHNDAETELDFYNIATDGGTTPAIVASGVVLTDYSFGQMLLNPMFKRTISSVLEDRHTLFAAVLTGDCLETANEYTQ